MSYRRLNTYYRVPRATVATALGFPDAIDMGIEGQNIWLRMADDVGTGIPTRVTEERRFWSFAEIYQSFFQQIPPETFADAEIFFDPDYLIVDLRDQEFPGGIPAR